MREHGLDVTFFSPNELAERYTLRPAELDHALGVFGGQGVDSIAIEEFVEGHEGFYDTLAIGGKTVHDFASHYFPNVLDAMRTRWIRR
jgi:hypothetical protein